MTNPIVPFFDLSRQQLALKGEIEAAVREVLDSGRFILGPAVAELEKEIAAYVRKKAAVGVSSGTDALLMALMALGIGPGDAVLTTPFSFFATAGVIARLGAVPLLADIDPVTFNLDPAQAEKAIQAYLNRDTELYPLPSENRLSYPERRTPNAERATPSAERLKALLPVHLYGQAADMPALNALARRYGLKVVEDAAQAIGAEFPEAGTGDDGPENPVCYSFYPTKNLGGAGDAGLVATDNPDLADKLRRIRVHGARTRYLHELIGGNFRMDTLQAAILLVKLPHLDDWTRRRQAIASGYDTWFGRTGLVDRGWVIPPRAVYKEMPGVQRFHIYNQYVVRVRDRAGLQAYLKEQGIGTEIYYPVPFHQQPCFAALRYRAGDFPEAERAAREVLALPVFPELTEGQQQYVVEKIDAYYRRGRDG